MDDTMKGTLAITPVKAGVKRPLVHVLDRCFTGIVVALLIGNCALAVTLDVTHGPKRDVENMNRFLETHPVQTGFIEIAFLLIACVSIYGLRRAKQGLGWRTLFVAVALFGSLVNSIRFY